jgi:hypothetical protein
MIQRFNYFLAFSLLFYQLLILSTAILNSVTPSIAQTIVHINITSNAWNTLKESFSLAKRASVSDLQSELLISVLVIVSLISAQFGKNSKCIGQFQIVHIMLLVLLKLCAIFINFMKKSICFFLYRFE